MARLLDILRTSNEQNLGQALIRLAEEAAAMHRVGDAADRAADKPHQYSVIHPTEAQCRVEGIDPRTAADDVRASGTSLVVKEDADSVRSILESTSLRSEVKR